MSGGEGEGRATDKDLGEAETLTDVDTDCEVQATHSGAATARELTYLSLLREARARPGDAGRISRFAIGWFSDSHRSASSTTRSRRSWP